MLVMIVCRLKMADELWETLRFRGLTPYAPSFVQCRVMSIEAVPLQAAALLAAGIPAWAIELTAGGRQETPAAPEGAEASRRPDFPKRPQLRRANMQAALDAARPENRA